MPSVYLNIGSNRGNRRSMIERAVASIAFYWPETKIRRSDFYESEPWGFDSPNGFLNLGIEMKIETDSDPATVALDVLQKTQSIEKEISAEAHRNPDGSYRDREIDIDIIAVDRLVINSPALTLPHPRAHLRDFVMVPLRQLSTEIGDFVTGQSSRT